MPTTFEFVREQLLVAKRRGVSQSDLFQALRTAPVSRRKGTYASFNQTFHALVRLGFVERMVKTEKSFTRFSRLPDVLADRTFYRITADGRNAPPDAWRNPFVTNYPEYADPEVRRRYYTPTGRPRGRPRRERRRRRERVAVPEEVRPVEPAVTPVPEPTRERPRRLRIPVSVQIESELPALKARIEDLRASLGLERVVALRKVEEVVKVMGRLFDRAVDALEGATGEEGERLSNLVSRLESAPEGWDDVRAGIARRNEVTLQQGIETLLLCCPE